MKLIFMQKLTAKLFAISFNVIKKIWNVFLCSKKFPKEIIQKFYKCKSWWHLFKLPILTFLLLVVRFDIKLLKILLNSFKSLKKFLLFIIDIFLLFPKSLKCLNFYKR